MRITRRKFINLSVASGSAFVLGVHTTCIDSDSKNQDAGADEPAQDFITSFLTITTSGSLIIVAPVPEIGQGVRTSLPALIAEELNLTMDKIKVVQGSASENLGGMSAAGSDSIADYYPIMRRSGATVKAMLINAAAAHWKIPKGQIRIANGYAYQQNDLRVSWPDLFKYMKDMPIPEEVETKPEAEFILLGKELKRVDVDDIVQGKAIFGIDVRMEGMKFAAVVRPPVYGGKVARFDTQKTMQVNGVIDAIEVLPLLPEGNKYAEVLGGVAVIAENTWAAFKGKKFLEIEWDLGANKESNSTHSETFPDKTTILREVDTSPVSRDEEISREYRFPLMAHMCMEPMNFTASIKDDEAILMGPTQNPRLIQGLVSVLFKIPISQVRVTPTLSGGGFGRRLAIDYAIEAAIISKTIHSPVKVVWSREEDVKHDYFRTNSIHRISSVIKNTKVMSWNHTIFSKPIGDGPIYEVQGAADIPLNIPNIKVSWGKIDSPVRIGSWRSVAHSFNSYVVNSWIDELASNLRVDTRELIFELLNFNEDKQTVSLPLRGWRGNVTTDVGRLKNVIAKAEELSGWQTSLEKSQGKGIAFAVYKEAYSCVIAKVTVNNKQVKINQITSVLDCGFVVDPNGVKAQMEGAIMDGISALFYNEITFSKGEINQSNFHDLQWTRIRNFPDILIELVHGADTPGGAGEPPFPAVAPAIANAIFSATGVRVYNLPAAKHGFNLS